MKFKLTNPIISVIFVLATVLSYWNFSFYYNKDISLIKLTAKERTEDRELSIKEMLDFQFERLKDIKTNTMPIKYRENELAFAKNLPSAKSNRLSKGGKSITVSNWLSEGPNNQGGRTKTIVSDITNDNILLAAAAAGGIWRSTDKGNSWINTLSPSLIQNVTCIVQDTRTGKTNIWYAGTGELQSNTSFNFLGNGIFKSTNNGLTWTPIVNTQANTPESFSNRFQIVWNIDIDKVHGLIYAAVAAGIYTSSDEGNNWTLAISGTGNYTSVSVNKNGRAFATIGNGTNNGIYYSDNGSNWTTITPTFWPSNVNRIVTDVSQSNPNILYVLANTPGVGQAGANDEGDDGKTSLWKYNAATSTWTNLSNNLPTFNAPVSGYTSQYGYDMFIKVKPNDENFVIIGGTNLYRTIDGFTTKLTDANWVGGYATSNDISQYGNHHPDQHSFYFLPSNPKVAYSAHDGGISICNDITASTITWASLNPGYVTTQFWNVALDKATANSNLILGGMQDNGTMIDNSAFSTSSWLSVNSGDGTFSAISDGAQYIYTSSQNANIFRMNKTGNEWTQVTPADATGFMFVTPFILDPNNTDVMYLLAGNKVWRNSNLTQIPNFIQSPTTVNWSSLNGSVEGTKATALAMSKSSNNLLYVGDNSGKIYKISNASNMSSSFTNITGASFPGGYISTIAVDPNNGNNIMVGFSNYSILSLFFSSNGGGTWTEVGGNLEQNTDGTGSGPSVRCVKILPVANGYIYFAATSIGLFSTSNLNGRNTLWELEAPNSIGNTVVETMDIRELDGTVIAGTFGKGLYSTKIGTTSGTPKATTNVQTLTLHSNPGETGSTQFTLTNEGDASLTYSISVSGDLTIAPPLISTNRYFIDKTKYPKNIFDVSENTGRKEIGNAKLKNPTNKTPLPNINGSDILVLDDGDDSPDDFLGFSNNSDFKWYNEFDLGDKGFALDAFYIYMRTQGASVNKIRVDVNDANGNSLVGGDLTLDLSSEGSWYTITLNSPVQFAAGDVFTISVETNMGYVEYPAGVDVNAAVKNKSAYFDGTNWVNIATISGYENAAFLIRASGTLGNGATNQKPTAVANVTPMTAFVNDQISFDASASSDSDGTITQYLWDFGDGTTSTQKTVQHSYSEAKSYTYSLTVTDDKGATDMVGGLINISETENMKVTVTPKTGTLAPGTSQIITVSLDATTVNEGTYTGQLNITTNGGNITLPIDYLVDVERINELPNDYSLSQNYPNPFNPSTKIDFSLPKSDNVKLVVFDLLGRTVTTLVNKNLAAGKYSVIFNAKNSLASGIYIYTLKTENFTSTKKLVLMK